MWFRKKKKIVEEVAADFQLILLSLNRFEDKLTGLEQKFNELDIEGKCIAFHENISKRYFDSLTSFIQWNKQLALMLSILNKTGNEDLQAVQDEMIKPFLDREWALKNAGQTERINNALKSRGEQIRKMREELHGQFLKLQRENKSTVEIQIKIDLLDLILKE